MEGISEAMLGQCRLLVATLAIALYFSVVSSKDNCNPEINTNPGSRFHRHDRPSLVVPRPCEKSVRTQKCTWSREEFWERGHFEFQSFNFPVLPGARRILSGVVEAVVRLRLSSASDPPSTMHISFIRTPDTQEMVLMELQGTLSVHGKLSEKKFADVHWVEDTLHLQIGNNMYKGRFELLQRPFVMVNKKEVVKDAAREYHVPVYAVIRRKIVFDERPKTVLGATVPKVPGAAQ